MDWGGAGGVEVNRLKNSIKSCKNGIWGKEPEGNHNDIPCIRVADFDRNNLVVDINDITYRNYSENKQREYLLNVGDLLIEKSGCEKQLVGFVVSYNHQLPAVYSNFIARMELKRTWLIKDILNMFMQLCIRLGLIYAQLSRQLAYKP